MITPDLAFWTRLLTRLAVEAACVVGIALLLDRLIRPAFWRRALWQSAVISLLLVAASELSGFGRGLASISFRPRAPATQIRRLDQSRGRRALAKAGAALLRARSEHQLAARGRT